jgi:hypothetical protein
MSIDLKSKTVYLSGPISDRPESYSAAFASAADVLTGLGAAVINPAELPDSEDSPDAQTVWRKCLARDVSIILGHDGLDAIVVMPGWEHSQGCQLEIHAARCRKLPVFLLLDDGSLSVVPMECLSCSY